MKRSRLRNKFLNIKSDLDRKEYNKQRNYVFSLLRKEKKKFYGNLNTSVLTDNRTFWKTIKPFLAEKSKKISKITLKELRNRILRTTLVWSLFSLMRLHVGLHFLQILLEN